MDGMACCEHELTWVCMYVCTDLVDGKGERGKGEKSSFESLHR